MKYQSYYYCIADHYLSINFECSQKNSPQLIPSYIPFQCPKPPADQPLLLELYVNDELKPAKKEEKELIRNFETGNGDTIVEKLKRGGYQFIIKNTNKRDCCLLQTDKHFYRFDCALNGHYNMRRYGINNAIMMAFAYAASKYDTLLIHASLVRQNGYGYAFTAKSGTGKSTQVSMWLRYLKGCDLMNDDNPAIRIIDDEVFIYGTPWSGKTPCYRNIKAKLGAITQIDRALTNSVERLSPINAFAILLPSCSGMRWDKDVNNNVCNTVTRIIELTSIYTLHCLPNREAAEICNHAIARK